MHSERRFAGLIGQELKYVRLAYPDFDIFQGKVGQFIADYKPPNPSNEIAVLDVGCGYGFTSDVILKQRRNIKLSTIDNEPAVIAHAHDFLKKWKKEKDVSIIEADALSFVRNAPVQSFDVVVSVLTIHNFAPSYRNRFLKELSRIIKPGGLFINADKYALNSRDRYQSLAIEIKRYFDVFVPLGKYDLLKEWVLHHILDSAPGRVMYESSSLRRLVSLGFVTAQIVYRNNMIAILKAEKSSTSVS